MPQCPEDRLKHRSLKTQKSLLSIHVASNMGFWTSSIWDIIKVIILILGPLVSTTNWNSSIWVIMVQRLKAQYRKVRPWLEENKMNWTQAAEIVFARSNAMTVTRNDRSSMVSPIWPLNLIRKVICLKKQTLKYNSCCFELDSLHG